MNEKLIHALFYTPGINGRWGLPALFWGKPGVGKTTLINRFARANSVLSWTILGSLREPQDFVGLPIPMDGRTSYAAPAWAADAADAKRALIFLDEVNTAAPSVQAALLRPVNEGVVGDIVLPPGVRFMLAANPVEDSAGGWDLAPPLANRMLHFTWDKPDADNWADWLLGCQNDDVTPIDPAKEEERVMHEWPDAFAKACALVGGFIRAKAELLYKQPNQGSPDLSRAWPSPRSWELATRALAGAYVHNLDEVLTDTLIEAAVGRGATVEFARYRSAIDLPAPRDVLEGRVKFKHTAARLDLTHAVLASCAALTASTKKPEYAKALWKILTETSVAGIDLVVPATKVLAKAGLYNFTEATALLVKMQPVLRAAGYTLA
jgi:MoxR-like ATPase